MVHLDEAAEERFLPLRSVDLQAFALFDDAHFVDEIGAVVEKLEQFLVDRVDLLADVVEVHGVVGFRLRIEVRPLRLPLRRRGCRWCRARAVARNRR